MASSTCDSAMRLGFVVGEPLGVVEVERCGSRVASSCTCSRLPAAAANDSLP